MPHRKFITPAQVFYGQGALQGLAEIPGSKAFVITDRGVTAAGLLEKVEKILRERKIKIERFDGTEAEPSQDTLWKIGSLVQESKPDLIIGLGGGSCLDAGKVASVLYEQEEWIDSKWTDIGGKLATLGARKKAKYVAISTTSGTGSEATHVAMITDTSTSPYTKGGWASPSLVADAAIADPELTVSMPPTVTANTGFDALIHAIECFVLDSPSVIVDSLALGAARTIWQWLPRAVEDGANLEAREKMHVAAMQAGMTFANGVLGVVHILAIKMGGRYHIPHGPSCAQLLCPCFAFLYPTHGTRLAALAEALGITGKSDKTRIASLIEGLNGMMKRVGIPASIRETGVDEQQFKADIKIMAEEYNKSMTAGRTQEQLRAAGVPVSVKEVEQLFLHAWEGTWAEVK
jgi:alcohol dehydrogenase class IV